MRINIAKEEAGVPPEFIRKKPSFPGFHSYLSTIVGLLRGKPQTEQELLREAFSLYNEYLERKGAESKSQRVMAAALIYLVSQKLGTRLTWKEVAKALGVAEFTAVTQAGEIRRVVGYGGKDSNP